MKGQRGFTLVEVLIAIALFVGISFTLLGLMRMFLNGAARSAATAGGTLALDRQSDAMRSDAATAFAVFVPSKDVFGASNAPAHEVDFYSKSDTGTPVFWAYFYDALRQTLRRYDYDTTGDIGQADRATGAIDTGRTYPAVPGVTSFTARTLEAADLAGSKSEYGAAVASLFAGKAPASLPVGFDDGAGARPDLYGGNTTVDVQIGSTHGARTLHLASATLPSGFTIHEQPELRGIVYRVDSTDRSWFGLVQKSHVFIQARLLVSWDHFATTPHTWCDYNLYGYPNGLSAPFRDGVDRYHPEWFVESTAGIVYHVIHGDTAGSKCSQTPPSPSAADPSVFTPPPGTIDTPPPCFMQGACWPAGAPVNWDPSPAPSSSPPAWWCATHAQSPLCPGLPVSAPTPVPVSMSMPAPVSASSLAPVFVSRKSSRMMPVPLRTDLGS